MTGSDLFRAIGNISDEYVAEAERFKKKTASGMAILYTPAFRRFLTSAACLVVCVGLAALVLQNVGFSRSADSGATENAAPMKAESSMAIVSTEADEVYGAQEEAMEEYAGQREEVAVEEEKTATEEKYREEVTVEGAETETVMGNEGSAGSEGESGSQNPGSGSSAGKDSSGSNADAVVTESWDGQWDADAVRSMQASYPNDYQELYRLENELVVHFGEVKAGGELWDAFLEKTALGESARITVILFTIEGDALIRTVYYDGSSYHLIGDNSRDGFGSADTAYFEGEYKYLYETEEPDGNNTCVTYTLSDSEGVQNGQFDSTESFDLIRIVK